MRINRYLRNQEGSSPGGGAAPIAPADPAAQAGAQTPAPAFSPDVLKGVVTEVVAAALPDLRNGIFAELRKSGAFAKGKDPGEAPPTASPPPGPAPASSGLSKAEVEAMLELERVVTTRATKLDLGEGAIRRMRSALSGIAVENLASEADSYVSDLGLGRLATTITPPSTTAPAQPAPVSTAPPISDKGSPAPGGVLDWEREYAENPIGMSSAARQRMDAKYGAEKARRMRVEAAQRQAETIRVTKPQG